MIHQQQVLKTISLIGIHPNQYIMEMLLVNFNPFEKVEFPNMTYPVLKFETGTLIRL